MPLLSNVRTASIRPTPSIPFHAGLTLIGALEGTLMQSQASALRAEQKKRADAKRRMEIRTDLF